MDNDKSNIDFKTKDIQKKDIQFNIEEKKSTKFKAFINNLRGRITSWRHRLLASPLFKGKRTYVTLSATVIIIAAAITLPIVLPKILNREQGTTPEPAPEEVEEEEEAEERDEVIEVVNNLDPNVSDEVKDAILTDLDSKIAATANPSQRRFLIQSKAHAMHQYGMYDEAIEILEPLIDELRTEKDWQALSDTYLLASNIYTSKGDKNAAITAMREAISAIEETAKDNAYGIESNGKEILEEMLRELEHL